MVCRSRLAGLARGAVQCVLKEHGALVPALPSAPCSPAAPCALSGPPGPSLLIDSHHLLRPFASSAAAPLNTEAIKELRARTGAPMKDVKAALEAANWDMGTRKLPRVLK